MNENAFFLQMDAGVWVIVKLQSKVQTSVSLLLCQELTLFSLCHNNKKKKNNNKNNNNKYNNPHQNLSGGVY